ncbi:hypothetical protein [Ureaplasma canigenitalium]|uniref:hypothetical protein n=1 Tax=Ureaplasma canigenitalium TaxID=42092 RepID=UPI000A6DDCA4|nr:hypothetical protein [Ureaplasma canigenitalium]
MKKNKVRILAKVIGLLTITSISASIVASCAKNNQTKDETISVLGVTFSDIKEDSALITINLASDVKINLDQTNLVLSNLFNTRKELHHPKVEGTKIIFKVNQLHPDVRYMISSLTINNQKIELNPKWKIDFETLPKNQKLMINLIEFFDIDETSAKLRINHNFKDPTLLNKVKFIFDKDVETKLIDYDLNYATYALHNLNSNTSYQLKGITLDEKAIEYNAKNGTFKTKTHTGEMKLEITDLSVVPSIFSSTVNLRLNQELSKADITFSINNQAYQFKNVSSSNKNITLNIDHLTKNTSYTISNITINQESFNVNKTFKTLDETKNDEGKKKDDVPPKKPNPPVNPIPDAPEQNDLEIKQFSVLNKTSSTVQLRVYFNHHTNSQNNPIFTIVLTNNVTSEHTLNEHLTNQDYIDFHINNLTPNTTYQVLDFKINNQSILNHHSFVFSTDSNVNGDNEDNQSNTTKEGNPSLANHTIYYDKELNVQEQTLNTFNDLKKESNLENYFNFINQKNNDQIVKEDFVRHEQNEIIDYRIENNKLIIKLKKVSGLLNDISLKIERNSNTELINPKSSEKDILVYMIDNLTNGELIKILGLFDHTKEVTPFKNKGLEIRNKRTNSKSSSFSFSSYSDWQLEKEDSNNYRFNFRAYRSVSNIDWPDAFSLKVLNHQNQIEYIDLKYKSNRDEEQRDIVGNIPKMKVKRVLSLVLKDGKDYFDLTNFNHSIIVPDQIDDDTDEHFNIEQVSVMNDTVKVSYTNDIAKNISKVQFLIKSLNPLQPWSKIVNGNLDHEKHIATFNVDLLPKNIAEYIIVATSFNNEVIDYGLNKKYQFNTNLMDKEYHLTDFKVIKDETNKQLYASASFDFNNQDLSYFKDKWFQFIFEPELKKGEEQYYQFNFVKEYKINVPFNHIWKFGLNGFYENTKYTLKKVKVVEPFTQNDYYDRFTLVDNLKKDFAYHFNYQVNLNNQVIKDKPNHHFNLVDPDLITNRLDLTRADLINYWLNDESKTKIPYSIQNHYALIEYERYHFYKNVIGNIKKRKHFVLVNENNIEVNIRVLGGRKIIDNAIPVIKDDHKKVTITEDLNQYIGLEKIKDDAFFIFRMELDNQKRKLSELTPLDPASITAKSFVSIPVSLKDIFEHKVIEDLSFSFLQTRGDVRSHRTIRRQMQDRFKFKVSLIDNKLKLEIIPRYHNVLIFDSLADHYFSLANSTFIGNVSSTLHWIKTKDINYDITFNATPLKDNLSTGLNETFIDKTIEDNEELFNKNVKVKNKKDSIKRLYKEDQSSSTINIRNRSFAILQSPSGTWSVLGKVKPHDDFDYNYYVITNSHVWKVFPKNVGTTIDGNGYKILDNTNFKVPIVLNRPNDPSIPHKDPYFDRSNTWNLNQIPFKIESIVDFDNDQSFPHPEQFKDTYGDSVRTNNGIDKWVLGRADLIIAKVDMSFFFRNFSLDTLENATFNGIPLNNRQKEIVRFFLNWKNLPFMTISTYNRHLSEYYNLNWFAATYPGLPSNNKDSRSGKRYREYLLGNTDDIFGVVNYLGATSKNPLVKFDTSLVDSGGGSSGTSVYDSKNRLVGFFVESTRGAKQDEKGEAGIFIIDGHKYKFFGDGSTPQNQGSFYERVRLLAYLYPDRYENENFKNIPKFYNTIE